MAKQRETRFKEKFRKRLEELPHSVWDKINAGPMHNTLDLIGCVNGFYVTVELKSSKNARTKPHQLYKLQLVKEANGFSFKAYPENADFVLEQIKKVARLRLKHH